MFLRALIFLLLPLLLSACAGNVKTLENTYPVDSPFHAALAREYLDFSQQESKASDWVDAQYFADKGLNAAHGAVMEPERLENWDIPEDALPALAQAREFLTTTLEPKTIAAYPEHAAQAMFLFDCWVEQQEENWQDEDIEHCREEFYRVLDDLMLRVNGGVVPDENTEEVVETPVEEPNLIFFDFNKSNLNPEAEKALAAILEKIKVMDGRYDIVLNGHADRAGKERYNMKLSKKRADTVRTAMKDAGLEEGLIDVFAFGETDPLVPTKDGEREPKNRRVEVVIGQ
jgi:OOP family OmpA-OmpF porin